MKIYKLILLLLWMSFIFLFSAQSGTASQNTSDVLLYEMYDLFFKNIFVLNHSHYELFSLIIRKMAHFFEYFVLAILLVWFLLDFVKKHVFLYGFVGSFLYALSDEVHQLFIQGRSFQIRDLCIDGMGALIGVLVFYYFWRSKCLKNHSL